MADRVGGRAVDGLLGRVWEEHRDVVGSQLAVVERAVAAAVVGELDDGLRAQGAREAHKLVGSVGTLGFAAAGERARELEVGLSAGALAGSDAALLEAAVRDCRYELFGTVAQIDRRGRAPRMLSAAESGSRAAGAAVGQARAGGGHARRRVDLLLVADHNSRAREILSEAQRRGLRATLAGSCASARAQLRDVLPELAVLDLALSDGTEAALGLLEELAGQRPVLVITPAEPPVDRVEIARRGGRGFLPAGQTPAETVDAVIMVRRRLRTVGIRVLALDHDPATRDALHASLDGAGMELATCRRAEQFWRALGEHQPDLVILDHAMPIGSGPEICRMLRRDPRWEGLPVLFLAATDQADAIHEMFNAGADDYIHKPFVGADLSSRIFNRLERVALHRALADQDPLTGALNRERSVQDIERLLRVGRRTHQPVTLATLDLDHFKAINHAHGHPTGDIVLRETAQTLKRFLRGDDVVARWGDDEFVIAMYGIDHRDAHRRINELQDLIRNARFGHGANVHLTVTGGLAESPTHATRLDDLHLAATEAMRAAKQQGRDRTNVPPNPIQSVG